MLSKILLLLLLVLAVIKLGLRLKFRELARKLDRAINATGIAIVLVYAGWFVWWLVEGRH